MVQYHLEVQWPLKPRANLVFVERNNHVSTTEKKIF